MTTIAQVILLAFISQQNGAKVAFESPDAALKADPKAQLFPGTDARIVRVLPGGTFETLPLNHIFKSGETIQLKIRPSITGYLAFYAEASPGNFVAMFPHPRYYNGSAAVRVGEELTIPLTFDSNPSTTTLYLAVIKKDKADKEFPGITRSPAAAPDYKALRSYVDRSGDKGFESPDKQGPTVMPFKSSESGAFAEFKLKNQ